MHQLANTPSASTQALRIDDNAAEPIPSLHELFEKTAGPHYTYIIQLVSLVLSLLMCAIAIFQHPPESVAAVMVDFVGICATFFTLVTALKFSCAIWEYRDLRKQRLAARAKLQDDTELQRSENTIWTRLWRTFNDEIGAYIPISFVLSTIETLGYFGIDSIPRPWPHADPILIWLSLFYAQIGLCFCVRSVWRLAGWPVPAGKQSLVGKQASSVAQCNKSEVDALLKRFEAIDSHELKNAPMALVAAVCQISDLCTDIEMAITRREIDAESAWTADQIADIWMPEAVCNYFEFPRAERDNFRLPNGRTVEEETVAQLECMQQALADIRARWVTEQAQRITVHGSFLHAKLER